MEDFVFTIFRTVSKLTTWQVRKKEYQKEKKNLIPVVITYAYYITGIVD